MKTCGWIVGSLHIQSLRGFFKDNTLMLGVGALLAKCNSREFFGG